MQSSRDSQLVVTETQSLDRLKADQDSNQAILIFLLKASSAVTLTGLAALFLGSIGLALGSSVITARLIPSKGMRIILISSILAAGIGYHFHPKSTSYSAATGTVLGSLIAWRKRHRPEVEFLEGTVIADTSQHQQKVLNSTHRRYLRQGKSRTSMRFAIGTQLLSGQQNHRHVFAVGAPGSGKTQALHRILQQLRHSPDWRVIVLDRNGEFMRQYYNADQDLINNPFDARTLQWSHQHEGVPYDLIARSLIPDKLSDEPLWPAASRELYRALAAKLPTSQALWKVLTESSLSEVRDLIRGMPAFQYFGEPKLATNVMSFFTDRCVFYETLPPISKPFSFFHWAASDSPNWIWMPIFELQEQRLRPYLTLSMDLIIRGLLSHEGRQINTAIVIDELAALDALPSLGHLLSQGRKYKTTLFLATQALAQVREVYGENMESVLLQTTQTKLILNSPDPDTATKISDAIGDQVCLEAPWTNSLSRKTEMLFKRELAFIPGWLSRGMTAIATELEVVFPRKIPPRDTWTRVTRPAVHASELQSLPPLEGYLLVNDGTPVSKVSIPLCPTAHNAQPFIPRVTQTDVQFAPEV